MMKEKFARAKEQLPYLPDTVRLIWSASRAWTTVWAGLLLLQGLLPIGLVYLTGALADKISLVIRAREARLYAGLVALVVLIAVLLLLRQALNSIQAWVRGVQAELVQDHIYGLIHRKAVELDLSFYDSPAYYDRLFRARVDASDRPVALLENAGALLQNTLTFTAMAAILLRYAWWIPAVLVVGMLPALAVVTRFTVREFRWRSRNTEARRRADYFDWILTDREAAAEIRSFGLGNLFRKSYQHIRARLRQERAELARSQAGAELAAGAVALVSAGAVMVWVANRLFTGAATLGEAAILFQAFSQGQGLMQTVLGSAGQMLRNMLFIDNLFEFLRTQPKQPVLVKSRQLGESLRSGIRFENVSFSYPGGEQFALRDFELSIAAGEVTALVGENGAGKSTVIKLLCRFYDPCAGRITIDGQDLAEFSPPELWHSITVLFQEPVRYHDTAGKNIAFGDVLREPGEERISEAAEAAGAHALITKLPEGYETVLGRWFGGAELSSGEWQRLALARAFLRRSPIMVLDEPTSAMDSWAEADWMGRFRQLAAGRTAILITHRFTTAMQADIIHVMHGGRVIEAGTHAELMKKNGKYARSWQRQMRLEDAAGR